MYSKRFAACLASSLLAVFAVCGAAKICLAQVPEAPAESPPAAPADAAPSERQRPTPDTPPPSAPPEEGGDPESAPPESAPRESVPAEPKAPPAPADNAEPDHAGEPPSEDEPDSGQAEPDSPPVERPPVPWDAEVDEISQKKSPDGLDDLRRIQKQVRAVVEYARPATVGVQVNGSVGSAVIVSEEGLALTAGHVAMKPNQRVIFLFADGRRARGVTLGVNSSVDSGMMKITDKGPWPYVPMAPAGSISPGDWVIGLGQPNGYFRDRAPPVRLGRVLFDDPTTLCTDVTLVGGDSGGPLFNLKGQVVGIHSRIGRRIVSNYHVPIDQYHTSWDRLAGGQMWGGGLGDTEPDHHRAFLGVAGNSLQGRCRLTQVYAGRPAARAGLKEGDIVTSFDGEAVESFEQFGKLVVAQRPGTTVKIGVERSGEAIEVEVRLGIVSVEFPGSPPLESDS